LHIKRFYVPELEEWVTLKVSAAGLRTINKKGIYNAMVDAGDQGHLYRR
jgi:large subunit ribosomal protein L28